MQLPTRAQATAFGRHIVSYAAGGVSALALLHVVSSGDAQTSLDAINQISDGVAKIAGGVATLVSIGAGVYASITASPLRQLLATVNTGAKVETTPELAAKAIAAGAPADKVTS